MKTKVTEMLGIDLPVFAFSHCRDVVVEVSKSGGFGVLGCAYHTPERLHEELRWIDDHIGGKPYGIDILIPDRYQKIEHPRISTSDLPSKQTNYLRNYLDEGDVPRLPADRAEELIATEVGKINMTREQADALIEVALEYPVKLVVNALGVPPSEMVELFHSRGIKVGSLVGKPAHAIRQKAAGVDIIVAQGMEAGGHTGDITSMILWPQIVDAVAPTPVLAAGGIGRGRQMAAAFALGAEGIWCGSIWLNTRESELTPEMKQRLIAATAHDTVQSKARTGKQCRILNSKLIQAWEQPDAPEFLPMPLQTAAMAESRLRVERARAEAWLSCPVGQIVGTMNHETTCKQVVYEILDEFADVMARLQEVVESE